MTTRTLHHHGPIPCPACCGMGYHEEAVALRDDSGDVEVDLFRCEDCGGSGRAPALRPAATPQKEAA